MEKHSIDYGKRKIDFIIERKNVKNINLNIRPDMTVVVSANEKVPTEYIIDFVKSKAAWIVKNIGYFKGVQSEKTSEKEYVSGESFKYLGRQYRLKVEEDDHESIRYYRGYIEIKVKDKRDKFRKEVLLKKWFREKSKLKFKESLERVYPNLQKHGIEKPDIQIRTMKARWGSCLIDKGIIILNYDLIKAPKFCIDYVVLHELIHFKYKNHNSDFYRFMTMLMPDWKERKEILDGEVVMGL